jgi:hypothetical protein
MKRVDVVRGYSDDFRKGSPQGSQGNPMAEASVLDKLTSILRDVFR